MKRPGALAVSWFLLFAGAGFLFWKSVDLFRLQQANEAILIDQIQQNHQLIEERDILMLSLRDLMRQPDADVRHMKGVINMQVKGDTPSDFNRVLQSLIVHSLDSDEKRQFQRLDEEGKRLLQYEIECDELDLVRFAEYRRHMHQNEQDLWMYKSILARDLMVDLDDEESHQLRTRLWRSPENEDEAAEDELESNDVSEVKVFQRHISLSDGVHAPSYNRDAVTRERRQKVKEAMIYAWSSYEKYAWGFDELAPFPGRGRNTYGGLGVSIIDSLDTLYIMGLHDEFKKATEWVAANLHFDKTHSASVSETTSRVLGGLLSAYDLSGRTLFLTKAQELADKLLPAWDTATGIPMNTIDLASGNASNSDWTKGSNALLADLGSEQLEFFALSLRTGEAKYVQTAWNVIAKMREIFPADGLLPICISHDSGKATCTKITFGAGGGNFYADLLKSWMLTDKRPEARPMRDMWEQSMEGLLSLVYKSAPSSYAYIAERWGTHQTILDKMDEVACFAPGMLALGADDAASPAKATQYLQTAEELAKTCYSFYFTADPNTAAQNYLYFKNGEDMLVGSNFNPLRGTKTIESFFYLWRKTSHVKYRDWAWDIFQTFERTSKGYTGDSTPFEVLPPMDSFFLANTLKYLYLLYSPSSVMPLDKWVFNTQGHPVKILKSRPRRTQGETVSTAGTQPVDDHPNLSKLPARRDKIVSEGLVTVDGLIRLQTGTFTWTIENFSKINARKHYSESFVLGGYKWRVSLFPDGNNNVDFLSCYLDAADSASLPSGWSVIANFNLAVIHQFDPEMTVRSEGTRHQFNEWDSDWGFERLIPLEALDDPSRGFLVNDSLVVEADVRVVEDVDFRAYDSNNLGNDGFSFP